MKRTATLIVLFLGVLCAAVFLGTRPSARPITVLFVGYTNEAAGTVPEGIFELTNNTAGKLRCQFAFDCVCTNGLSSGGSGEYTLAAHSAETLLVATPDGTNGWQAKVALSVSGPRPVWQQRTSIVFSRLGLGSLCPSGERIYPPSTNVWAGL